jgi:hypothetical protein
VSHKHVVRGLALFSARRLTRSSYNSAIFTATAANSMRPYVLNETMLASTNISNFKTNLPGAGYMTLDAAQYLVNQYRNNSLTKLSPLECINAYGADFQSSWSDVILVTSEPLSGVRGLFPPPGLIRGVGGCGVYLPSQWVCGQFRLPEDVGCEGTSPKALTLVVF